MVDAIVSPLLEQLISMAAEEGGEQVRLVVGVKRELSKLKSNLEAIRAVLVDAERRQMTKEETAKLWLDQLKYVAYDMEDVLDEWNTARLKLQIERVDDDQSTITPYQKKMVCCFSSTLCCGFKHVFLHRDIALKIKDISKRLDDIVKQKDMFNLNVSLIGGTPQKLDQVETISFIDVSKISGRDMEKNSLISKLVVESNEERNDLHIISLVGMGGIGKTTLAQLAYNDNEVKRNFEKRIWVCASDPFDEFRIAKAIIEGLEDSPSINFQAFQSIMTYIKRQIIGKKFLLVLDDVWNENYKKFESFYNCLKNGMRGSKILITTRKETVALTMRSIDIIPIKELKENECWSLFKQFAFFGRSNGECEKLEEIGQKIVGKCKGLPLAIKTIGSLLCSKNTEQEWQVILNSEMWELEELEQGLLAPLLLSYNDLPSMIKLCLQYCAIFPKDHKINKDELIKLWMAQGYLNVKGSQEMEIVGQSYFNILANRYFFQEFEKDEYDNNVIISCKMHDIVHDFAQYVCRHECFTMEVNSYDESLKKLVGEKVHHLMLQFGNGIPITTSIYRAKKLRSLLIYYEDDCSLNNILLELFSKLICLRTFDISSQRGRGLIDEVPKDIGKLVHMRYLNLSWQRIKKLPETLCELYNLQTLDITECRYLEEIPQGIGKLINMRYLLNDWTDSLKSMPVGIARLTSLRTLKKLTVNENRGEDGRKTCTLASLKDLNLLQECRVQGLGYLRDVGEAKRSRLEIKKNLLFLDLEFCDVNQELEVGSRKNEDDEQVLEDLQPPPTLRKLWIYGYRGYSIFCNWLMSLTNLRELRLCRCSNCEHLPPLGKLPSLEKLSISELKSVKRVGNEFLGILESDNYLRGSSSSSSFFPNLKSLEIGHMNELEEWEYENITGKANIIIMPRLSSLELTYCPKVYTLPHQLLQKTTLQHLVFAFCPVLKLKMDRSKIPHIPHVDIV